MAFAVGVFLATAGSLYFLAPLPQEAVQKPQIATSTVGYERSAPVRLVIPKIKLDAPFEGPLGLNEDHTIQVPKSFEKLGWYQFGATPGEKGTAVILGHVDSYRGPAIFWSLKDLEPGDEFEVDREDGTKLSFVVTSTERYDQNDFPTEKVYSPTDYPSLRLITCTGVYNHGTQRYSQNLVVYAALKEGPEQPQGEGASQAG
jgi:sortase (surface protein transpeptidase)